MLDPFLEIHLPLKYWWRFFSESNDEAHTARSCNTSDLTEQCGKNQRCRVTSNGQQMCECQRDFYLLHGECIRVTSTAASDVTTLKPEQRSESGGTCIPENAVMRYWMFVCFSS